MPVADGLLRVTAVAGGRRSDLAVPGGVAVAELLPDLARAVGLLDPAAVYAGYRVHAHGRRLRPDRGLREQGVEDGALLAVAVGADAPAPAVHDDLADATAAAVERQRAWRPAETRRTTLVAGLLAVVVGLIALGWELVPRTTADGSLPGPRLDPGVVAAVVLALVVLAGHALPAAAVALGVARADSVPVDPDRLQAMVARSARVLLIGSAAVGVVATLAVPVVVDGSAGAVLAVDCCVVLLLRARRHRAAAQVAVDVGGGLAGLFAAVVALLARHPEDRSAVAAGVLLLGALNCALTRLPAVPSVLRARLLDVLEVLVLVALAPLLLVATDGLARIPEM
ncbi:EsaB/YukD family protein [Nocardioides bizhenqiangii]|uniref:EsaB/YukD family protein n=1 Tax=Nocardioides bizhenqiangii TaxID=3095076 RepID=A0ABZ0ZRD8_9ACTN|nr:MULTISPECIES: EsaB/YukD family protein [unclassified Nocardioides]MDZ5622588.1 EsaB/YukD family protein [Nocardioides sp. HM23]WQQ26857.1 EsaB/YukD family protein [Nocardioides sp. HM61]